jgi:hypothetical protein
MLLISTVSVCSVFNLRSYDRTACDSVHAMFGDQHLTLAASHQLPLTFVAKFGACPISENDSQA